MMKRLKQNHVKYGLILTGFTVLCLLLMLITSTGFEDKSPLESIFLTILPLIVLYFGVKAKKKLLKNNMTFKQGFIESMRISLVYAVISPFVFMLYYLFLNPTLLEYVRNAYGLTGAPASTVIAMDMAAQFIGALIIGAIYGAIVSFFLKSK